MIDSTTGPAVFSVLLMALSAPHGYPEEEEEEPIETWVWIRNTQELVASVPLEKQREVYLQELRKRIENWKKQRKREFAKGSVPENGHKFVGTWLNDRDLPAWTILPDGTFKTSDDPEATRGTWRIGPSGTILMKFSEDDVIPICLTEKGFSFQVPWADCFPSAIYRKKEENSE